MCVQCTVHAEERGGGKNRKTNTTAAFAYKLHCFICFAFEPCTATATAAVSLVAELKNENDEKEEEEEKKCGLCSV